MKAIIYAAGKSPRLLPLTKNTPVSLLKIKDKTILDLQIEILSCFDFSKIIIVSGFQVSKLETLKFPSNVELFFDPYYEFNNIPASFYLLKEQLKEDFVMLYSDILFQKDVLQKLMDSKNDAVLAIDITCNNNLDEEAEKVIIENELINKISKLDIKKENVGGEFIGLSKFSSNVFSQIEKAIDMIIRNNLNASFIDFLNLLIKFDQSIHYIETDSNSWTEIDFSEDLEKAQSFLIK